MSSLNTTVIAVPSQLAETTIGGKASSITTCAFDAASVTFGVTALSCITPSRLIVPP